MTTPKVQMFCLNHFDSNTDVVIQMSKLVNNAHLETCSIGQFLDHLPQAGLAHTNMPLGVRNMFKKIFVIFSVKF